MKDQIGLRWRGEIEAADDLVGGGFSVVGRILVGVREGTVIHSRDEEYTSKIPTPCILSLSASDCVG